MTDSTRPAATAEDRRWLEQEVASRAAHRTAEDVRITCSFARAERLLGREYHGRFLIELLQNAADAWREDDRSRASHCRAAVLVTKGPALLVANQGAPMTPGVVIKSLGQIGASTKPEGEAIGHKGIGFKSVLELTQAPQIFSGLREKAPILAVDFDPYRAHDAIKRSSRDWHTLVQDVPNLDHSDPLSAVPTLRFPHWVDDLPAEVSELGAEGYDTVVRLPFDERFSARLKLDERAWLSSVRDALADVSDQILLLLGCFSEVFVDDQVAKSSVRIRPQRIVGGTRHIDGTTREEVRILRNKMPSTRWHLYRRALPDLPDLAGEVAVGIRVAEEDRTVLPAVDGHRSAPFHLFFPTRIASGLPFLLHGYFQVDAARTGFYRGSADRNTAILTELAMVVAHALATEAQDATADLVSLVDLVAAAGEPEEPLAADFRDRVLDRLDAVRWIPTESNTDERAVATPAATFVWGVRLTRLFAKVFPADYVQRRTELALPDEALTEAALALIEHRSPRTSGEQWEIARALCCPGADPMWQTDEADHRFRALLDLSEALAVEDRSETDALFEALRRTQHSRLLPAARFGGEREMLPVPDPAQGTPGNRSRLVMARVRAATADVLVPPEELDLDFIPEGLLSDEDIARARPLGVRPFTVDNVLDRLNGIGDASVDERSLLGFVWQLLSRERVSAFGTRRCAERAVTFDPGAWFWCVPGRAREDETARLRQQRERYLTDVPLPSRDGGWRPAGTLAFGSDWADWLQSGALGPRTSAAVQQRIAAYRGLELIGPSPTVFIASPAEVLPLLPAERIEPRGEELPGELEDVIDEHQRNMERLAFLLRLGVWEVPPIEAYENRERTGRDNFPWVGPIADRQREIVDSQGGWRFGLNGWSGTAHHNVYLGEDYRFRWDLKFCATKHAPALAAALQIGTKLYEQRSSAQVFCMSCRDPNGGSHQAPRYSQPSSGYPSWLALQLRHERWVACTLDGSPMDQPQAPAMSWWHQRPPAGSGLRQSPWRFLPLCGPGTGVGDELRRLANLNTLDDVSKDVVLDLLASLRSHLASETLAVDPYSSGSARQAFVGLHRLAYRRLGDLFARPDDPAASDDRPTEVLCELGDQLTYRAKSTVRHDDGRFSAYVRHFVGAVPFVVLQRDPEGAATASRLGIEPFRVSLSRRGDDDGIDVTGDLREVLGDRIPELLAILVHHALGTQTLELSSVQFDERAHRLKALYVRQTADLVIDAVVKGTDARATIGESSDQDLFLEQPTSSAPVLFHDLTGEGWPDRFRRKFAPYLAAVVENPAYAHTFALFLQAESDAEREEFLLELGISQDEVDVIRSRVGVIGEEQSRQHIAWYQAILLATGASGEGVDFDETKLTAELVAAGFDDDVARRLVEAGGGEAVRRDASDGSALRLLSESGVDPYQVHEQLVALHDAGLNLNVSRRSFARWIDAHGRRLTAVLARGGRDTSTAKADVRTLAVPASLALSIHPPMEQLLAPVIDLLTTIGTEPDVRALIVGEPAKELARLGGFDDVEALDQAALLLYDEEEQRRLLRDHAQRWRREIRLIAVLLRTGPADTRSRIRSLDDHVHGVLPANPVRPTHLESAIADLFVDHPDLAAALLDRLSDSAISVPPARENLMELARSHGLPTDRLPLIERALDAPRLERARQLLRRVGRLTETGTAPKRPAELKPFELPKRRDKIRKKVPKVNIGEAHDRRKRELGGEGEEWALAAVLNELLRLDRTMRTNAIDSIVSLLSTFKGPPVDAALAHATAARMLDADEDELVDELTGLLHLSRHSDAFGFDLLGWLSPGDAVPPQAMCLEVKSSGGEGFLLSHSEWSRAEAFHEAAEGDRYAVLVVRRAKRGGVPSGMDLLADPVALVEADVLRQEVDGYKLAYRAAGSSRATPRTFSHE